MDVPDFPQPMYEAVRDLSQDFLFPGLEQVPPNTVTLLETNAAFVEAVPGRTERRNELANCCGATTRRISAAPTSGSSGTRRPEDPTLIR